MAARFLAFIKTINPSYPWRLFFFGNFAVSTIIFSLKRIVSLPIPVISILGMLNLIFLTITATLVFQSIYRRNKSFAWIYAAIVFVLVINCFLWSGYYSPFSYAIWLIYVTFII